MNRLRRLRRCLPLPFVATIGLALLCAGGAEAFDTGSEIEGVWTFNGGQIAVHSLSNGTYEGTVVKETTFASCPHPVGQQIWSDMTEQKDGSFWGLHQWYEANCKENPTLGLTAWRILEAPDKSHYLRVCFSHPGDPQPEISANGDPHNESEYAAHHVTYGCTDSALVAPLPVVSTGGGNSGNPGNPSNPSNPSNPGNASKGGTSPPVESLSPPSTKQCLRQANRFTIRLKDPQYDPFKTVTVLYKGHRVTARREGHYMVATIKLGGLHKDRFTVVIKATTVLGHKLSARRTYHICGKQKHKRGRRHKKG